MRTALKLVPKAVALACLWLCGGCPGETAHAEPAPARPFMRVARETNGVVALQVALRRLAPVGHPGPDVWLAAVTHLGTSAYYEQLQTFLDRQALVLYEAVQTEDGPPAHREGYSLQASLAEALGLRFQLDALDYDRPHFRNSDLSLDQLSRVFALQTNFVATPAGEAGVQPGAVEFGALVQAMTGEGLLGGLARLGVSLLAASPRLQAATKVVLIEVLGQLPGDLTQIAGLPPGMQRLLQVLVEERNQTVVRDVEAAVAKLSPAKSLAVFYGAGHMADLEQRLAAKLGYRPVEDRWLTAFDVNPQKLGISTFELEVTRSLVRQQLKGLQAGTSTNTIAPPAAASPSHKD